MTQVSWSSYDWRVAVELSKDSVGLQEILNKEDIHTKNQAFLSLPNRLVAKIFLFRTIFRGSGWSFANDPDFMHVSSSATYWDEANQKFYEKYKGLDKKHNEWAKLVASGSPITGPTGRFWPIPMGRDAKGNMKLPMTVLSNFPVQGTAADIMSIARVSFFNRLKALGLEKVVLMASSVHDSIVVDCPSKYKDQIAQLFHAVFADLPKNMLKLFGYVWEVPLECEVKAGMDMKNMSKV